MSSAQNLAKVFIRKLLRGIAKLVQAIVIRLNRFGQLREFNKQLYYFALKLIVFNLKGFKEVKSIYLLHSFESKDFEPGYSDIDLLVLYSMLPLEEEIRFKKKFFKRFALLRALFPLFSFITVLDERTFKNHFAVLERDSIARGVFPQNWNLLYGIDLREHASSAMDTCQPLPSFAESSIYFLLNICLNRKFRQKEYARNKFKLFNNYAGFLHGSSFSREFGSFWQGLKKRNYLLKNPREHFERFYYCLLFGLDEFYGRAARSAIKNLNANLPKTGNPVASVPEPVLKKIKTIFTNVDCIESAILCPKPFVFSNHTLFILLKKTVSFNELKSVLAELKRNNPLLKANGIVPAVHLAHAFTLRSLLLPAEHPFDWKNTGERASVISGSMPKLFQPPQKFVVSKIRERALQLLSYSANLSLLSPFYLKPGRVYAEELYELLAYKLYLANGIIALSPEEIFRNYATYFGEDKNISWFKEFHEQNLNGNFGKARSDKAFIMMKQAIGSILDQTSLSNNQ